ncbi:MAG: xanthine dehydrogenase molybdopterin binding subunit [Candidatus Eremiobacteraeota bacterium]|nr:xanthine dehydrogenase molybdopterin binding subunit [Candidatus Eremiobacteraeota bacterium]
MESSFEFVLNGRTVRVSGESTNQSLLCYLRAQGHTGTKEGCAEGDCGACTVAVVDRNAAGKTTYRAINSCIALLPSLAGREVVTVEGIGTPEALHPVQAAMVRNYGSQCGFCTPGFIASMFEGYYRENLSEPWQVNDQLNGNLCRCTGYRPIRDAFLEARQNRDAGDRFQQRLGQDAPVLQALDYNGFLRPTSLKDLLQLRAQHPAAELVCGATELGVYINKANRRYPLLISTEAVPELTRIERREDALVVGAAASLTALEESLEGEFPQLQKMLLVFASRPIRNRASLGGNLVTASPIGDMAPVLLSLDASVQLAGPNGTRSVALADFFVAYRKTVLAADEVMVSVSIPRRTASRVAAYKVSKRRELDIAIVSAGFAVELDPQGVVTRARLAYGGVAAIPSRARQTEDFLVGKPWDAATVEEAKKVLAGEFAPIDDVRAGAWFRRELVPSLLEKFWLGEEEAPPDFCVGSSYAEAVLKHESAIGHVTGTAQYVDDQACRRTMLEVWPVLSTQAHARVTRLDIAAAEGMPGVVKVLTAQDVPGINDIGALRQDEALFGDGLVCYHGQMVAAVVGRTLEECKQAARAVVVEYEPLPQIRNARQALAQDSFHTDPHVIRRGDVEAALKGSPHVLRGEFDLGGQEHFYLEAQAAWAERGDDGDIFVCSSTQHPSEIQAVVSHVLHLPRNKVVVEAPRMGGGFGGKETQGNGWASLVALAAWKTGQPVRLQLDRDIDMTATGKRHPFFGQYEVGFDGEGRLTAARARLVSDGGWALDLSESILDRALFHLDNAYYIPAVEFTGQVGKTNNCSHTAYRGFGGPQGMVYIEEMMDRVARHLGLEPELVRERNLYHGSGPTNTTHYGQPLGDNRIPLIWEWLREQGKLAERRAAIAEWNSRHPHKKRGLAMTPVKFGISFTASFLNQAGALVHIYRDGTVQVNHGGTEMGQGLYTKMRGVAMRELGLSADQVRVMKTRTDKVPNTSPTAASSGADLNGAAVRAACEILRARLAEVAARMLAEQGKPSAAESLQFAGDRIGELPFAEVVDRAYLSQVSLSTTGYYRTPGLAYDKKKGHGIPFYYYAYGAAISEVEVDGLTGMKRVLRVDILQDVGDSLNPNVDRGQIEGAFVQGMGWLTGEELKWSQDGRLLSHSASTYQIPSIGDAPAEFNVTLLPKATQPGVIHGSKAVGEPPFMLALSVREAIREAIAAFAPEKPKEVALASPATHEAIFAAIQAVKAGSIESQSRIAYNSPT